jgi:hypothetical protein
MLNFTIEDARCFAVLAELASLYPEAFEKLSAEHQVKPEWMVGLLMKFEKLTDDTE